VPNPTAIRNLRAYFCQVLTRETYRMLGPLVELLRTIINPDDLNY
jgi:hypothetical protein